jgi:hypothetical protein
MIRKHSAKVLTLRNIVMPLTGKKEETLHFVLIGGRWWYNGTNSFNVLKSEKDGFWKNDFKYILSGTPAYSLKEVKKFFYEGPNKSMQIATREWTTNQEVYGVPF